MLLSGGTVTGKQYLSSEAVKYMSTWQTGEIPTGFFQNDTFGQHGLKYGWGIGTCVLRTPHPGVAAMLSWVAGLAAVPVPAGAGVREATFVALAGLPVGVAATIAVASRLLFVTVDVLGALCAAPWAVPAARPAQSDAATP